jgi:hypothetical protein
VGVDVLHGYDLNYKPIYPGYLFEPMGKFMDRANIGSKLETIKLSTEILVSLGFKFRETGCAGLYIDLARRPT